MPDPGSVPAIEQPPAPQPAFADKLRYVIHRPFGLPLARCGAVPARSINWVIPDPPPGSGGHLNIFRMIANLEALGWDCRVAVAHYCRFGDVLEAKRFIDESFMQLRAPVFVNAQDMPPAVFTMATAWDTAYCVRDFQSTAHKAYFIQDFEPWFFPAGSFGAWAEQTYRMDLLGITSGGWLAAKLRHDYGMRTVPIGFSYDKGRYRPLPRRSATDRKRVFFYGRPSTPRRGFELGVLALAELHRRLPELEVVIAGCDTSGTRLPFPHVCAGIAALDDLPQLYSDCDVALVLSFSNLSLLPLELMASGCPVVSNRGPNVEWLLNDGVAVLCDATVESLCAGLWEILRNEERRTQLIRNGLALANDTDWMAHARTLAGALSELDSGAGARGPGAS